MRSEIEKIDNSRILLQIHLDESEVSNAFNNYLKAVSKTVQIPGFRYGKAPKNILVNYIGKERISKEVSEELVKHYLSEAINEHNIIPVGNFNLEKPDLVEGKAFSFKVTFDVKPKIENLDYTGHTVKVKKIIVDDKLVEKTIEMLRQKNSPLVPVTDGEVQLGDYIFGSIHIKFHEPVITTEQTPTGPVSKTLTELNNKDIYFEVSDKNPSTLPLVGCKIGDIKTFDYTFSHESESHLEYYGKKATVSTKIERISRPQLRELNEEFISEINPNCKTLDDLKETVKKELETRSEQLAKENAFDQIMNILLEKIPNIKIPEALIEDFISRHLQKLEYDLRIIGVSFENYIRNQNISLQDLANKYRPKAEKEVKMSLIFDYIIEKEKINITETEKKQLVLELIERMNMPTENMSKILENPNIINKLSLNLILEKVKEVLLSKNQIEYDLVHESEILKER